MYGQIFLRLSWAKIMKEQNCFFMMEEQKLEDVASGNLPTALSIAQVTNEFI
ncbi:hypothetical protein D3C72_2274700 [compost metagenome]